MELNTNVTGPLVDIRGIRKSYGGVHALRGVDLAIAPGEVHALCGENGAGKSTLIKIMTGSVVPDHGTVTIGGTVLTPGDVHAAERAGLAVIHQESTAFVHLNAYENIFAGHELTRCAGMLIDRGGMRQAARTLLEQLGEQFDDRVPLERLSVAQRQMVAIARALSRRCTLLIMDEPTASLSARETDVLFDTIRRLRTDGISILYVSHRLEEVFELSDRITVLRDGQYVGTHATKELDKAGLIALMVGRQIEPQTETSRAAELGRPVLEVKGLGRAGYFHDISFTVRAGEILGLGGLVGAGRSEIAQAVFGIDAPDAGDVRVCGTLLPRGDVRAAMDAGIALVPEDRQHAGLVLPMSIGANLSLPQIGRLIRGGLIDRHAERALADRLMKELTVRAPHADVPAQSLSGGNQQKVVVGKWLGTEPKILILDEPTRGVDVGAKAEIHALVRACAARGMAVLVISSELPELLGLSDRIIVMRTGTIAGELSRSEATQNAVIEMALPDGEGGKRASVRLSAARSVVPASRRDALVQQSVQSCPCPSVSVGVGAAATHPSLPSREGMTGGETHPSLPSREGKGDSHLSLSHLSPVRLFLRAALGTREGGLLMLLVLAMVMVGIVNPSFLAAANIRDMLVNCVPVAIVACGVMLVVVTGEIDISVGALMGFLAALMGILCSPSHAGLAVFPTVLITVGAGAAVGFCTGALVVFGRVPSIIVTLGMLTALRGLTEMTMGGQWIADVPDGLRFLGAGKPAGIPVPLVAAACVIAGAALIAAWTPLGRRIYALGSNAAAARLAGISAPRIKLFVFAFTGMLTGVATVFSVPQVAVIDAGIGAGFELLVVTAVVVGGVSTAGGRGTLRGVLLGVLLLGMVRTMLVFLRLGPMATYWEGAIQGAFILLAVLTDHMMRRRACREART